MQEYYNRDIKKIILGVFKRLYKEYLKYYINIV